MGDAAEKADVELDEKTEKLLEEDDLKSEEKEAGNSQQERVQNQKMFSSNLKNDTEH